MKCPKCQRVNLVPSGHYRWRCPYIYPAEEVIEDDGGLGTSEDCVLDGKMCGFQCGLSFFFDDESLSLKLEVGLPLEQLHLSQRALDLIRTGVLSLDDLEQATQIEKLPSVRKAQREEEELEELNSMMREVVGRSAGVHRRLTSGEFYRKNKSGGLIGRQVG